MTQESPFVDGYRLIDGTTLNNAVANPVWSVTSSVTATAGGSVTNSTKITETITQVTSAVSNAGIVLPEALPGVVKIISNTTANDIVVFAEGGSTVNGIPGNVGDVLPHQTSYVYIAVKTDVWESLDFTTGNLNDYLKKVNNLSDVASPSTACVNLGALQGANDLSDLNDVPTARFNLGLGSAAILASSDLTVNYVNVAALKAAVPQNNGAVYLQGYYTKNDGGEGVLVGVTGAAPGTYIDNGGTIILPTGGNGSSAWIRLYIGFVNVKWFGAKGDGTTDDTTAIQNAINLGQPTYIPGTSNYYRLTNQINGNSSTAFILRGDGSPSTRLVWEGSNGFYWNNTITTDFYGLTKRCQITGMSLLTTGTGGGAQAIFLRRSAVVEPAITIEDIFIAGKDVSTHYWDKGIVLTNVVGSWIKDYWFSGKAGDATSLSGLEYYQDVNAGSMVHWLESASIKWAQNGITIHANGSIGIEGVIIDNTLVVACRVPIWLNGSGASGGYKPPYVAITNAQLSVDAVTNPQQCIYSNKYAQVFIDNSVFYGSHLTSAYPLIDITDSVDVNINASYFVNFAASLERSGVRLNGNGYRNKISGCHFDSLLNGIEINGTQTDCVIGAGNTFANVTNRYSGSATSSASYFRRSMSGVATVASGSRVNFGCTFNVTPAVTVTHSGTSVVLGSSVSGVDTTGFTLNHSNGATVTSFYWTAIGD